MVVAVAAATEAVIVEPVKRRSLEELRAVLLKAKDYGSHKQAEITKQRIEKLEEEMRAIGAKEHASLMQTKTLKEKLEDHQEILNETKLTQDELIGIGQNPTELIKDLEELISVIQADLKKCGETQTALTSEKLRKAGEIDKLQSELKRLGREQQGRVSAEENDDNRGNVKPVFEIPQDERQAKKDEEKAKAAKTGIAFLKERYAAGCRKEIQKILDDAVLLPLRLTAYSHDRDCRTLLLQEIAGRIRVFDAEPEFHNLNETEGVVLRKLFGELIEIQRNYGSGHIEAFKSLKVQPRPIFFTTWQEYSDDAKKQLVNYFNPQGDAKKPTYGVVKPADPAPRPAEPPVLVEAHRPQAPVMPKKVEKPIERTGSPERRLRKLVEESGVLKNTRGLKVSILAGQADKNGPMRDFLEEIFEFKKLRWYDGKSNTELMASLKAQGTELLMTIPKWYAGYRPYVEVAKDNRIRHLIINDTNKALMVREICAFFGVDLNISTI